MSSEIVPTSTTVALASFETSLAAERAVEQTMMRSITKSIVIGVPIGVVFFIVLLTIALAGQTQWYVIVGLGSIMGVLGALLFGMLGGVTVVAHQLEDVDRGSPSH